MANLFSYGDVKNHPRRSGFDLSKKFAFTAKAGELLPVYWRMVYPGDKFTLSHQHFTRTRPVNTAAFTRIREYFDWYYVPLRLLNKNLPNALVQMTDQPVQATGLSSNRSIETDLAYTSLEHISDLLAYGLSANSSSPVATYGIPANTTEEDWDVPKNQFGFVNSALSHKLLRYLRYGNIINRDDVPSQSVESASFRLTSAPTWNNGASSLLDFGYNKNFNVNLLPLLAYQKVYADFFRFTQWENAEPYTWNFDYYTGGDLFVSIQDNGQAMYDYMKDNNIFTLRYANWNKDIFMGLLPEQQLGEVSVVSIGEGAVDYDGNVLTSDSHTHKLRGIAGTSFSPFSPFFGVNAISGDVVPTMYSDGVQLSGSGSQGNYELVVPQFNPDRPYLGVNLSSTTASASISSSSISPQFQDYLKNLGGSFSIIQLRLAEAVQRWKEISQCADQDYRSQIYAHFGVTLSGALSDKCIYIGGSASNIDISEVVNQELTEGDATIKGKGVGTSQGRESFTADEHGIIMCIYHAVPLLDYVLSGQKMELLYTNTSDLPVPEFDNIGLQTLPLVSLLNSVSVMNNIPAGFDVLGYTSRFIELKTDIDEVSGAFTTTLRDWVAPLDPAYLSQWLDASVIGDPSGGYSLNYNFFKVNPSVLNTIFGVACDSTWDTDQFLVNAFFDVKAVRNFDYDGMPY